MLNGAKKKKDKRELVYKPYLKGDWKEDSVFRQALKIVGYYAIFVFVFVVIGGMIPSGSTFVTWLLNLVLVAFCCVLLYLNGAREGESQVALGEIAYTRQENGKTVDPQEKARCFHPLKGWFTMLCGVAVVIALAVAHALLARKQVYALQSLPEWVTDQGGDVMKPLAYYQQGGSFGAADIFRVIGRLLIFPFAQIARLYGTDALLTVDRLSPLLVCIPALGCPLGYLTGPRSRAMVHGDIKTSRKNYQRRQRKALKARRQRTEKKNELI